MNTDTRDKHRASIDVPAISYAIFQRWVQRYMDIVLEAFARGYMYSRNDKRFELLDIWPAQGCDPIRLFWQIYRMWVKVPQSLFVSRIGKSIFM